MIDIKSIEVGDVFSENVHYLVEKVDNDGVHFKHLESGSSVKLSNGYVTDLLKSADQYETEVEVGLLDKKWTAKKIADAVKKGTLASDHTVKEGELQQAGIRTIFEQIYGTQVGVFGFKKANKDLTAKKFKELRDKQIADAVKVIEDTANSKKGVAVKAAEELRKIQDSPILPYEEGELRPLIGYKIQFTSTDGRYNCIDLEYPDGPDGDNIRPVNINTLQFIIFDGVKYNLEKQ